MDIKAMAKSKRSHTRHNQPRKPKPKPQPQPSSSSSSDPNPSKRSHATDPNSGTPPPPSLPSNWSRYDSGDEDDQQQPQGPATAAAAVGKGTSEGADLGNLIAQAKESQSHYVPPSFDQSLPDLYQGLGPMLAARGESMLPWDGGDDFLGEDEGTTQEVPFFNLDLQALAEQLEKVDLAKRLFIEEDLLPPELRASESKEADDHTEPYQKLEDQKSVPSINTFHELFSLYLEAEKEAEMESQVKTSDPVSSAFPSSSNPDPASVPDITDHNLDSSTFSDEKEIPIVGHIPGKDTPASSRFEAVTAEAELDVLLDSFNETKFFDSSPTFRGNSGTDLGPSKPLLHPSKSKFPSNLDNKLDELLEETSKGSHNDGPFQSDQGQVSGLDNDLGDLLEETSKGGYKSRYDKVKVSGFDNDLDDLLEETSKGGYKNRSDQVKVSGLDNDLDDLLEETSKGSYKNRSDQVKVSGLDNDLDDLLEETSKGGNKNRCDQVQGKVSGFDNDLDDLLEETSKMMPVSSESKSKGIEDFDTWFDNL